MDDLFAVLMADASVKLTGRAKNEPLARLVNQLPIILSADLKETATVRSVMRSQHRVLTWLVDGLEEPPDWLLGLQAATSQHEHAELFLRAIGKDVHTFWRELLVEAEAEAVESGQITVGELLSRRPKVFVAPLLCKMKIVAH